MSPIIMPPDGRVKRPATGRRHMCHGFRMKTCIGYMALMWNVSAVSASPSRTWMSTPVTASG